MAETLKESLRMIHGRAPLRVWVLKTNFIGRSPSRSPFLISKKLSFRFSIVYIASTCYSSTSASTRRFEQGTKALDGDSYCRYEAYDKYVHSLTPHYISC